MTDRYLYLCCPRHFNECMRITASMLPSAEDKDEDSRGRIGRRKRTVEDAIRTVVNYLHDAGLGERSIPDIIAFYRARQIELVHPLDHPHEPLDTNGVALLLNSVENDAGTGSVLFENDKTKKVYQPDAQKLGQLFTDCFGIPVRGNTVVTEGVNLDFFRAWRLFCAENQRDIKTNVPAPMSEVRAWLKQEGRPVDWENILAFYEANDTKNLVRGERVLFKLFDGNPVDEAWTKWHEAALAAAIDTYVPKEEAESEGEDEDPEGLAYIKNARKQEDDLLGYGEGFKTGSSEFVRGRE